MSAPHIPVMLSEMLHALSPRDGGIYVDGTFGAGGYSRAILTAARCKVFALDRDPDTRAFAEALEAEFPGRFVWIVGNFSDMCRLLAAHGVQGVDGVVLDLGVSSMQLDRPERGFSFQKDGPLDMRMGKTGLSAAEFLSAADERAIADVIYAYGEEHASRRIARAIVQARAEAPIETTLRLARIVEQAVGRTGKTHPATRTFQALRIHINDEMGEVERGLEQAQALLSPGGRLVVVTFHSLEDRMVKRFTHSRCGKFGGASRHVPETASSAPAPIFFLPRPEKTKVSAAEAEANPRARSATLRWVEKGRAIV